MAINQTLLQRNIITPTQNIQTSGAFDSLGQAAGKLGEILSTKASDLAIDQARQEGELDASEGRAPENLMPPLTTATKSYNKAVRDTEARHMLISAREQVEQSLINHTNPANFNNESPAKFKSELQGIMEGTLANARDSNKAQIQNALEALEADASIRMLKTSINYDNKKIKQEAESDIEHLRTERRNEALAGNWDRVENIDSTIDETINDYSTRSEEINALQPKIREELERQKVIDKELAGYTDALATNQGEQWLSKFLENEQGLPFDLWQETSKQILSIKSTHDKLINETQSLEFETATLAIDSGDITSSDGLDRFTKLNAVQLTRLERHLQQTQAKNYKSQSRLIEAQKLINQGRTAELSGSVKSELYQNAYNQISQAKGENATLADMSKAIIGQSPVNVSGVPAQSSGTNFPAFDNQLSNYLTSKNPAQVAYAASIYNDMAVINNEPNTVNISGNALAIAKLYNTLNQGGIDPEQAAELAINAVQNTSDPEINERKQRFNRDYISGQAGTKHINSLFKDVMGVTNQAYLSDKAFNVFKDTFRSYYLASNSEQAAIEATKYHMRDWATSSYYPEGYVGRAAPEKELPITQVGHAFSNQLRQRTQLAMENIKELSKSVAGMPDIQWSTKEQVLSEEQMNMTVDDASKVFERWGNVQPAFDKKLGIDKYIPEQTPTIKIDGHESPIVIKDVFDSRLGKSLRYGIFYYDKFNNLQPLPDPTSPTGQAEFQPAELEDWAPGIYDEQHQEKLKEQAIKIRKKQLKDDIDGIMKNAGFLERITMKNAAFLERTFGMPERDKLGMPGLDKQLQLIQLINNPDSEASQDILQALNRRVKSDNKNLTPAQTNKKIVNSPNVALTLDALNMGSKNK